MNSFRASLIFCAIATFAGTAMASSGSLVDFKPQVMPVLVQVDAHGRVTDVQPSFQLTPWSQKLLTQQLDAWISQPARDNGHPVSSRFIVEVAMRTIPRKDGKYDASFVYVKSLPAPLGGAMHWNIINGGLEIALVEDGTGRAAWNAPFPVREPRVIFASRQPRSATAMGHVQPEGHARAAAQPQPMPVSASPAAFSREPVARPTNAPSVRIR
jgi:hypothetical protein